MLLQATHLTEVSSVSLAQAQRHDAKKEHRQSDYQLMIDSIDQNKGTFNPEFNLDLWGLIGRHYPTVLTSMILCCALGAIYFAMTAPVYESRAEIHIEEKVSPVFTEESMQDRPSLQSGIETHLLLLKSPLIFEKADAADAIKGLREFQDVETHALRTYWENHLALKIPDFSANVLSVAYQGKDPEESQRIVQSVIDAYQGHLNQKSAGLGKEVSKLVNRAKDELLDQLSSMEADYATFRKNAPVMWKDGEAVNLHNERQIDLEARRKELIIEKSITEAKLTSVIAALESGSQSARDAIYYEALIELQQAQEKDQHIEREAARGYSAELSREYMQLAMEEKRMAAEFGNGHPDLQVIRVRLAEMKKALRAALGDDQNESQIGGEKVDYVAVYTRMLAERISSLKTQVDNLDKAFLAEEAAGSKIEEYLTEDERHRASIARTQTLFDAVVARLEEINIIQEYGGETMEVIAQPALGEKVWPKIPMIGVLSMLAGMCLGGMLAIVREITDRVYHDPNEIRAALGIPVLGQVPTTKSMELLSEYDQIAPSVRTVHASRSRFSESFRGIRTALQFSSHRKNLKVLQVTSPLPGDGKSTFVANLASSAARGGKRVLVIDADMRRPQIHKIFGVDIQIGLADLLDEVAEISDVVKPTQVENLSIVSSGIPPENPAELLSREIFKETLEALRDDFDLILVDGPPVLAVSDPSVVSTFVDGVVMILKIRKGIRHTSSKAKELLQDVEANLVGVVVNGVAGGRRSSYGYDYGYGYGYGYTGSNKYYEEKKSPYEEDTYGQIDTNGKHANGKSHSNGQREEISKQSQGRDAGRLDDTLETIAVPDAFRIDADSSTNN